ncbi:MAG: hypothetical protein A2Y94_13140 [Caldithrix sp. RBG_13_44_9]|nr:MAG: hypothetical protein A2Y94_13140 [Caldithrix sp. RBG_13_44_9]
MNADSSTNKSVATLYDQLSRFMVWQNYFQFCRRITSLTIHKTLHIPPGIKNLYDKKNQGEYINDVVLQSALPGDYPIVLDAGCGFGSTIFRWYSKKPGKYVGYSLSPFQVDKARREAARRGISSHCQFFLKSYDDPIAEKYQYIIAIESLIHANDLQQAVTNLVQALLPGGKLIIVDDMAETDLESDDPDLVLLKKSWSLNRLRIQKQYSAAFKTNHLKLTEQRDFTGQVRVSREKKLKRKKAILQFLLKVMPFNDIRFIVDAYLGGFALEELYRRKKVNYILMVGQK